MPERIPDSTFPVFRANLNTVFDAAFGMSASSTAPTTTQAYMLWMDTSTSPATLKMRNAGNTAWFSLGTADINFGHALYAAPLVGSIQRIPYHPGTASGWTAIGSSGRLWSDPNTWLWYEPIGGSIGNAASGATVANDKMQRLFLALWGTTAYTISGGKGASATSDWNANKALVIPDCRGRVPVMSGQGSGLTLRSAGATGGAENHVLSTTEMPAHGHGPDSGIAFMTQANTGAGIVGWTTGTNMGTGVAGVTGGGAGHNNMQPWIGEVVLWALQEKA